MYVYTMYMYNWSLPVHVLGESKRRTLPLWLREELEKLERKKAKQLEKEARERAFGETEGRPKWAEELERDREREEEEREREREGEKWKEWQGRWAREEEEEEKGARDLYRQRSHSSSHVSTDPVFKNISR